MRAQCNVTLWYHIRKPSLHIFHEVHAPTAHHLKSYRRPYSDRRNDMCLSSEIASSIGMAWHGTVLPRPFLQLPRTDPLHNVLRGMRSASGGVRRRAQRGVTHDSGTKTSISPSVWRPASYTEHRVSSQHAARNTAVDCGAANVEMEAKQSKQSKQDTLSRGPERPCEACEPFRGGGRKDKP